MKKIFLSTILLAVCVSTNAQQKMKVLQSNGTITEFNVADVTKVYFEEISNEELLGRWICTSSTFTPGEDGKDADNYYWREDRGEYKYGYGVAVGEGVKLLSGNKCFFLKDGYAYLNDGTKVADPTEAQWDDNGTWTVSGNKLTIIEGDDDRFVGTYEIGDNKATFTYKTQDWNWDYHTMTGEYPKTYVSVFEKK